VVQVAQILVQEAMEPQGVILLFHLLLLLAAGMGQGVLPEVTVVAVVVVAPARLVVLEIHQVQAHLKAIMLVLQHPALIITVLAAAVLVV
jgi:hypothetical protein